MKVFVTGAAGFIGAHVSRRLLDDGHDVLGYDGMTAYYDIALKRARLALLVGRERFGFVEAMLEDKARLDAAMADFAPDIVIHLAAQAGVRYSLENPEAYIGANVAGTFNLLEAARGQRPRHLLFASTSSIYGGNAETPSEETDRTDFPLSLYAATKKAGEAMSHAHAHLHKLPVTCFRFFTVYGPWGRPDMAFFKFVDAIAAGRPIDVYGQGRMRRDFTYIDDLVEAIVRLIPAVPVEGRPVAGDSLSPVAPWRAVNIAGGRPVELMDFIETIEQVLGKKAEKRMLDMQPGDVVQTHADAGLLETLTGYRVQTDIETGIKAFVDWYRAWRAGAAGPVA